MILSIIVALNEQGGIGFENRMPWHLPEDLSRFKKLTMGHHLILGRKTYQSIGKPLPGRMMIVLSRDPDFSPDESQVAASLEDGLQLARDGGEKEVFVVGGAEIYELALPIADKMYLTQVHTTSRADVFFPNYDPDDWLEVCQQEFPSDQSNSFGHSFTCLIRKISP
jgi:dihydrofolate reductase